MLTVSLGGGRGAVQVARSLAETERLLDSLRNRILIVAVVVVVGRGGARVARSPARSPGACVRLTGAAEEVAATGRLDVEVPVERHRRGRAARASPSTRCSRALARSKDDQQRLVQDAGHELRTPLTSLRTNISVLRRYDDLAPETDGQVLDDLDGETRELTDLVNELVELATDRRGDEPAEQVALGRAGRAGGRARPRRRTGRAGRRSTPTTRVVTGRPARARAGDHQPGRQRGQVRRRRRGADRGRRCARAASRCSTAARASPPTTCPTSSTASTAPSTRAAARAPGSAWPSCRTSPRSTAARSSRLLALVEEPSWASRCRPSHSNLLLDLTRSGSRPARSS